MVMVIRKVSLTNATGAVVAAGGAGTTIGQDYAGIKVKRTMAAIDIGSTAGKTQHASGMIFAEVRGGIIKAATLDIYRVGGDGFTYKFTYLTDATQNIGYLVVDVAGVSTLRLRDAAAANGRLVAGDIVVATIEVGNS